MIWGKTYQEQSKEIITCKRQFVWWPVKLIDGRYAWWQYIWAKTCESWGHISIDYYFEVPK